MSGVISNTIVTDGLILYYDGANPQCYVSGDTTSNDLSITQSTGTLTNGVTYDTDNNGSWVFDGIDDYIEISDNEIFNDIEYNKPFTFSIWTTPTTLSGVKILLGKRNGATGKGLYLGFNNNTLRWGMVTLPFASYTINTTTTYSINNLYHIVGTFDGSDATGLNIYVNKILQSSTIDFNNPMGTILTTTPVTIGAGNAEFYSTGEIYSAKIYNRELTQEEITQNYNAMKSRFNL